MTQKPENGKYDIMRNSKICSEGHVPITKEITKKRLAQAEYAMRKNGSIIKTVIKKDPIGKLSIGSPRQR